MLIVVKSSNGKQIGEIEIDDTSIKIKHNSKPTLVISDQEIIKAIRNHDQSILPTLFTDYNLLIGEIAALYGVSYNTAYKYLHNHGVDTSSKEGRRNSSYALVFSDERKRKISKSHIGKVVPPYIRTPEIKQKISDSLRRGYQEGRIKVNGEGISQAWADGRFDNVPMGRGIQGYFHSNKTSRPNGNIYFRSLLELNYLIISEEDPLVKSIINEPVHIRLTDGGVYVPDFLTNDINLVELKPHNHLLWTKDDDGRFEEEIRCAVEYCKQRGWMYSVIYDDDIGFETTKFKRYLRNNNLIDKYNIRFNHPEKISWS